MTESLYWLKEYPGLNLCSIQSILSAPYIIDKKAALSKIASGYPLAYILKEAPFGPMTLLIEEPLLIPRTNTWEWLCAILPKITPGPYALDLGTGPGTMSAALSFFFPQYFSLLCVDINHKALEYARKNLKPHLFQSLFFLKSDWFSNIPVGEKFDLILSNPPYCSHSDTIWMENTTYESSEALFADCGGLKHFDTILRDAKKYLAPKGIILLEHGANQGPAVVRLASYYEFKTSMPIHDSMGAWRATYVSP
jgi:release factor glutamine methyltransferase